ncbi:MAG TPA: hypothetical protein VIC24_09695 [Gemmatimonadaceae bacterium]
MSDFTAVLNRVQGDYAFYVRLQSDSESALAGYDLSAHEREALTNPKLLADALEHTLPWSITIKISGTHDWVNRTKPKRKESAQTQLIEREAQLIRTAETASDRRASALRLVQLLE